MSFLVTARKYRPATFQEVVAQGHVVNTLLNSIKRDRIAHAYLFAGPRGVGKTTTARIFAKALNCPDAKDGEPCNVCDTCVEITQGRSIDVIEIDGASNNSVDQIRAIRDAVRYTPTRDRYKMYIIDEIQKVYCSQGVSIHDKHVATIVRQMLRRVEVLSSGDTELLPGELVDRFDYEDVNVRYLAEGGEPATAQAILLGITRASLNKDSWLAAASFQETNRVLAAAALRGKVDRLRGLKENVILGKLIPSQGVPRVAPLLEAAEEEEEPMSLLS